MKITLEDAMAIERYSYTPERIEKLWAGRPTISPWELARLPISLEDQIRVLLRLAPTTTVQLWAIECTERAEAADPRSIAALVAARRHIAGEVTIDEMRTATRAAAEATAEAAWSNTAWAAWAAVWAADAANALNTAWAAYEAAAKAARAVARAAAEAAWVAGAPIDVARVTEREWQLNRLVELIEEAE